MIFFSIYCKCCKHFPRHSVVLDCQSDPSCKIDKTDKSKRKRMKRKWEILNTLLTSNKVALPEVQ